jgi:Zn finger protein HypA/HybF involved in hydrogenase expression
MKYKCKKCGAVFRPGKFDADCPKCGSFDVEVIYDHVYVPDIEIAPKAE